MSEIIKLPDLNDWFKKIDGLCWRLGKLNRGHKIKLDLEKINFIQPSGAIMLFLICNEIWKRTQERVQICNLSPNVFAYLERINVFEYNYIFTDNRLSFWQKWKRISESPSIIEITEMNNPMEVTVFRKKAQTIINKWFPDLIGESNKISTIILELCNNSIEHSSGTEEMGKCYGILQVYLKSNEPKIFLAIGDLGIGIRNHLKKKHSWIYSDEVALKKVLEGLSGRIDGSGGMGLPIVKKSTQELNGYLYLRSGSGVVGIEPELRSSEFGGSFPGMQCQIVIAKA